MAETSRRLLHQPVNGLAHALLLGAAPSLATATAAAITAGALVVTFLLAELSWRVLERPLIAVGQRLRYAAPPASDATAPALPERRRATG